MRVFKNILYSVLLFITMGLWVGTVSATPNAHGQLMLGNVLEHTNTLHITQEPESKDPLASFHPSEDFKEGCYWIVGMSTSFMFLCPLAAWEMTISPLPQPQPVRISA